MTKKLKRNLGLAWIDYKKAFDSVPHSWITTVLEIYKINPIICNFVKESMKSWRTKMMLFHNKGKTQTDTISIKRGIFQGDSLSPLLFCLALIPLTNMLNKEKIGFEIGENTKINHLLYMDDLKVFARDETQLQRALTVIKGFSNDIKMEFGLEKCATAIYKKGKLVKSHNIQLDEQTSIRNLEMDEHYKYLGVEEKDGIDNNRMKTVVSTEYYRRLRQILNTELSSKNKVTAVNTLAVPVITYSFGVVDWLRTEIENIDRKTRKLLTIGGMHHPKADVLRLYIKRKNGGRGLIELEAAYEQAVVGLSEYIAQEHDKFCSAVKRYDSEKAKYSIQRESKKIRDKYLISETGQRNKNALKDVIERQKIQTLQQKPLHGQYFRNLNRSTVDKEGSVAWLGASGLKGETESLIIAAQDQALATRYYQKHILKQMVDPKCRLCGRVDEHISHIIADCTTLAPSEYTNRHNKVASFIHWSVCKEIGLQVADKYYEHVPEKVISMNNIDVMWDMAVITDRTILANRPDIVIHDRNKNTCVLVDVSVPDDGNLLSKETEKISKYKDLEIEISRMWNTKTKVVPVIVGALGMVRENIRSYLQMIPGNASMYEVQKIALMGTAHILRKVLG